MTKISKLINTSTFWQYFDKSSYNPVCLYAATKQAFENLAYFYHSAYGISVINLALYDTYGPHDPRKKLFYLLQQASNAETAIQMTKGEQEIDLVYVSDVASAYQEAIQLISKNHSVF